MKKEEALQIIKVLIDQSVKSGLFQQAEAVLQVTNAYNTIATELIKENDAQ